MARILVIEDDADVRTVLSRALTGAGHSISEARNGKEAEQHLKRQFFDLVSVDILMPERDGFETIQAIRKSFPHVKIIAISGAPSFRSYNPLETAKFLGADRAVSKPFEPATILRVVQELLATD